MQWYCLQENIVKCMYTAQERITVCAVTGEETGKEQGTAILIHFSSSLAYQCGNNTGTGSVLRCLLKHSMRFLCGANKLIPGVMLVSMLSHGQENSSFLEVCREARLYVRRSSFAMQVQEQTQDNLILHKSSAKMWLSMQPLLRGTTQDTLSIL